MTIPLDAACYEQNDPKEKAMRDVLLRLELLAAWLKPGGAYPDEPAPDKYSTLVEAIAEIKRLRALTLSRQQSQNPEK